MINKDLLDKVMIELVKADRNGDLSWEFPRVSILSAKTGIASDRLRALSLGSIPDQGELDLLVDRLLKKE